MNTEFGYTKSIERPQSKGIIGMHQAPEQSSL